MTDNCPVIKEGVRRIEELATIALQVHPVFGLALAVWTTEWLSMMVRLGVVTHEEVVNLLEELHQEQNALVNEQGEPILTGAEIASVM